MRYLVSFHIMDALIQYAELGNSMHNIAQGDSLSTEWPMTQAPTPPNLYQMET